MTTTADVKTTKGEQTRARILQTALDLFREQGYEATTMRAIAERANVALGSAYYYFRSKEQLIQAFYHRTHIEHLEVCQPILATERRLRERLRGVMLAKIQTIEPYHEFAGLLFKTAADPRSPLNPFSADSATVRDESIALFADVVRGSNARVPPDLQAELPELLWLYHMEIILFWIHDRSPNRARTYRLTNHSVDLIARLIPLASLPLLHPIRRHMLRLLADIRGDRSTMDGMPTPSRTDQSTAGTG